MAQQFNKEQRKDIYLDAVDAIYNNDWKYCCSAIERNKIFDLEDMEADDFLEFRLFKPNEDSYFMSSWFDDKEERIFCLLLCAEMCND